MLRLSRAALLLVSSFHPSTQDKKLISYGSDWPNTAYVRQHVREMEKHPFDGIVIAISRRCAGGKRASQDCCLVQAVSQ